MANSNTFKMLKEVIYSLYDNNGNERPTYIGIVKENNVSEVRIELLKNIIKVCLESNWFSEETKVYLKNRDLTLKRVNEVINEQLENERSKYIGKYGLSLDNNGKVKYNNTVSKIMYDQKKLNSKFGGDFMTNIVVQKTVDISNYEIIVNKMLSESFSVGSLRDNLCLNIRDDIMFKEYDGDFIDKYGDILRFYLKSTIKSMEEMLNKDKVFVGYFNYLLSGVSTDDKKVLEDRKRLDILLNMDMSDLVLERLTSNINVEDLIIDTKKEIKEEKEVKVITSDENEVAAIIDSDIETDIIEDDGPAVVIGEVEEESSLDDLLNENRFNEQTFSFDKFNIVPQVKKEDEIDKNEENSDSLDTSDKNEVYESIKDDDNLVLDNIEEVDELDFDDDEDDFINLDSTNEEEITKEVVNIPTKNVELQLNKVKDTNNKKEKTDNKARIVVDKNENNPGQLKTNRIQF